jgi:hypothetical protein
MKINKGETNLGIRLIHPDHRFLAGSLHDPSLTAAAGKDLICSAVSVFREQMAPIAVNLAAPAARESGQWRGAT